jgi:hypothetical protein
MKCRQTLAALAILPALLAPAAAYAQSDAAPTVPSPIVQEILIKTTILTLNDANVTGNYTVFHARISAAWQKQTTPEKLADSFKSIRDAHNTLWSVAVSPVSSKTAEILPNGFLHLAGELTSLRYDLKYIFENGDWELVGISVNPPSKK